MNTALILSFCASLLVLAGYVSYAVWRCGVPASLSETYYILEKLNRPRWLFTACLALAAFLLIPAWVEASASGTQFLAFLSCAALLFVAFAPAFGERQEGRVHTGAAIVCALSGLAWCCVAFPYSWIVPAACIASAVYPVVKSLKKWLFWTEMAAFASVYVSLLVKMIIG